MQHLDVVCVENVPWDRLFVFPLIFLFLIKIRVFRFSHSVHTFLYYTFSEARESYFFVVERLRNSWETLRDHQADLSLINFQGWTLSLKSIGTKSSNRFFAILGTKYAKFSPFRTISPFASFIRSYLLGRSALKVS